MARKSRSYGEQAAFSMTSLMDVMTIILVFLIKQVDTEGQLITPAENLVLPNSTSTKVPKEVSLGLIVDQNYILVDAQQIVKTQDVREPSPEPISISRALGAFNEPFAFVPIAPPEPPIKPPSISPIPPEPPSA